MKHAAAGSVRFPAIQQTTSQMRTEAIGLWPGRDFSKSTRCPRKSRHDIPHNLQTRSLAPDPARESDPKGKHEGLVHRPENFKKLLTAERERENWPRQRSQAMSPAGPKPATRPQHESKSPLQGSLPATRPAPRPTSSLTAPTLLLRRPPTLPNLSCLPARRPPPQPHSGADLLRWPIWWRLPCWPCLACPTGLCSCIRIFPTPCPAWFSLS